MKKFLPALQIPLLLLCSAFLPQARADLTLRVIASPTTAPLGSAITYSITLSNTSIIQVQSVQISSSFPPTATILRAVNNHSAANVQTNAGSVTFGIPALAGQSEARMELQLRPAARGNFANNFQAAATGVSGVATNVVVNIGDAQLDLGLGLEDFPAKILMGDAFNYTVTVTNFGPAVASSVSIQTVLPNGVQFVSVAPAIPSNFNNTTRMLSLNAGTFTNNTARDFRVRLQASTALTTNLITSVVASGGSDTFPTNNSSSKTLTVLPFVTTNLSIVSVSPQKFNRQNALFEQIVVVKNLSTNTLEAVRVLVTNLAPPNELFNAAGTNAGRPYVMVPGGLAPTNSATVLLQYYSPMRTTNNAGFLAVEGPDIDPLIVPTGGAPVRIVRRALLWTVYDPATPKQRYGSMFIEFAATPGRTYSLVYSTAIDSSNWIAAQPPFVANSNFGQFIDAGPQVSGEGDRFYWVIEHP